MIDTVAREHYGRLVAILCRRTRDPDAAADAVGAAFIAALETWPRTGVPDRPEAWLLTAARNHAVERWRRDQRAADQQPALVEVIEALLAQATAAPKDIPDERLRLLFTCAHPAIDPKVRAALMLQLVLGVEVPRMAGAFLNSPATLAQRLVRVKAKIRLAGIPFDVPEPGEWSERLHDVLEAVYGAFTAGFAGADPDGNFATGLRDEALYLSDVLLELMPHEPEVLGLRALMLHSESRRNARFAADGRFVPLSDQDPLLWNRAQIEEAEALLERAALAGSPGAYQIEAAIQSAHASRRFGHAPPWPQIALLYRVLLARWPSNGARVAAAVAFVECGELDEAKDALQGVPQALAVTYAAWWAAQAHLLAAQQDFLSSAAALRTAAGLVGHPALRQHLLAKAAAERAELG